ncbi:hypothetical protein HOG21_06360 [bacterium]|nr:hypothetical protein [bacterium]
MLDKEISRAHIFVLLSFVTYHQDQINSHRSAAMLLIYVQAETVALSESFG